MLPLKLTRLQLLRVEASDEDRSDLPGETEPLYTDLEAIEEVFIEGTP